MLPRILPLLALALFAHAADDEVRDLIYPRSGPPIAAVEVVSEGADEVTFKVAPQAAPSKRKSREIIRIAYAGLDEGQFKTGFEALAGGRLDQAATAFQGAAQGPEAWHKVYGSLWAGEALERAGKFADAAKAFAVVADGAEFADHRLRLDALYRKGFALARAKDAGADAVIAALVELSKGRVGLPAEARAQAIRCAVAIAKDPNAKIDDLVRRATLRSEEVDAWFHFNRWLAATYQAQKRPRDAARTIDQMLGTLEKEPALAEPERLVDLRLAKGLLLADTDPQAALVELIRIDALPYGTADQQVQARFTAGRLLLDEAKALQANPETAKDEKKAAFVAEQRATARHLLMAASASPSSLPAKAEAAKLLTTLP